MALNYKFTTPEEKLPELLAYIANNFAPNSKFRRLVDRDGLRCHWCKRLCNPMQRPSADLFPTKDHLVRIADGGKSNLENLVIACSKCNSSRHGTTWQAIFTPEKLAELNRQHETTTIIFENTCG